MPKSYDKNVFPRCPRAIRSILCMHVCLQFQESINRICEQNSLPPVKEHSSGSKCSTLPDSCSLLGFQPRSGTLDGGQQVDLGQHKQQLEEFVRALRQKHERGQLTGRVARMLAETCCLPAMHGRVLQAISGIIDGGLPENVQVDPQHSPGAAQMPPSGRPHMETGIDDMQGWLEVLSQYEHFLTSHGVTSEFAAQESRILRQRCGEMEEKLRARNEYVSKRKRELDDLSQKHGIAKQQCLVREEEAESAVARARADLEKAQAAMRKAEAAMQACKKNRAAAARVLQSTTREQKELVSGGDAEAAAQLQNTLDQDRHSQHTIEQLQKYAVSSPPHVPHTPSKSALPIHSRSTYPHHTLARAQTLKLIFV